MKRKKGIRLDPALYRHVQKVARRLGRSTNAVIEDALTRFLSSRVTPGSVVEATKGTYKASAKAVRAILSKQPTRGIRFLSAAAATIE